ncbi:MAG: hypothetical protein M3M95_02860 [Pseudomonadota bacterium]|nr:hypothetical protein [Pseudomonadota bacterium]
MTKPLMLAAAASLAVSACATREPVRTVFLSAPGAHHYIHASGSGRDRVVVIRDRHARGPLIVNGRYVDLGRDGRFAGPDPEVLARITREARLRGEEARWRAEEARRRGAEARLRGEEARRRGEEARRRGAEARLRGEEARRRGEEARARGEEARRRAERLREQCERGEIDCEIIVIR